MHPEPARLAASPEDYERFKLEKHHIQQWEDGQRVDTAAPNIEWWYFDTDLDDGAKLAVIFCTKDASRPNQPLEPLIEIDLDLPDGRRLMKYGYYKAEEFERVEGRLRRAGSDRTASRATCTSTRSRPRPKTSGRR